MNIIYNKKDIFDIAAAVLTKTTKKVFCFYGEMGVGKTTLIKVMLQHIGAVDCGNSPTFGIVNEYHDDSGELLAYHFDFYRLSSEEEAYDLGLDDYFEKDAYIFIEWPEKIPNLLPEGILPLKLLFIDETTRRIEY
ncbi:tRNA (adenosine(37)-N6)-threonylcarbamoyltransferase complex ATPase subunit type 1 TsaE [Croceitalea sp. MTPC5]|uniref:tRNA (adenosine(37)-N6)-threonylcarbamoyltransferase complex ATPase subunit type 1 TsaE n=1 Tax=Croceitalea sp. MTPC5 TaxID=3056565 RepID=UPI002B38ECC2|nr:tRNA (adenosine(37)-N6)-threonylcarbamoyltransferase complex ATPase subunit type 1 TsaE [Croceitalea sp. MTPC5]